MIKYVSEFLGTLIILLAYLKYKSPIAIGVAVALGFFIFSSISGGYFNPVVSFMNFVSGTLSRNDFVIYSLSQLLAVGVALRLQTLL
jgi:glycerol uptake facilitator-like aquaporin